MDAAEAAITYILINVTQPPMNDLRVRRAFNMAIDKVNYSKSRKITKPLRRLPRRNLCRLSATERRAVDPEQARKLLGEAGFPVTQEPDGSFECKKFPAREVKFIFHHPLLEQGDGGVHAGAVETEPRNHGAC